MGTSIAEAVLHGANKLRKAGVPEERREAGSLLMHVLGRDRTYILGRAEDLLTDEQVEEFSESLEARAQGKPLQYITGRQEFFGIEFEVNNDVLIPRPETELLVEAALSIVSQNETPFICDVGTGSGCIAITLLHKLPRARGIALDISAAALAVAERNANRHGVQERLSFVTSDCFAGLGPAFGQTFDLIVSNPPYVAERAVAGLQREVRDFEPRVALTAGEDGLSVIRRLLVESGDYLKSGGCLIFEMGFDQHDAVKELIDENVWKLLEIYDDLQGIPRTVALMKRD
ncbi:MAG TPA: peptide chain release factor N(5)-glutamine methyltransferase [Pyrinomonadaceae bacterium]|nr:peptide chain release factor N(5)-glutamine methyltransferase [Pyrinomonadaceae bacterium]